MVIAFYATNNFTGDGTTVNWNINFADGYIDTTNVKARYLDNTGSYVDIAISSVAGNVVTISPAVANGQEFQIYRDTEKRFPLVDFSDGAILNETNLDTLATQAVMVSAEAFDQSNNGVRIAGDALNTATGIADTANLALSNSETALTTANGISSTANTALANSNAAIVTANDASSVANGIASTADAALQNSATALSTANAASDTANAIAGTANSALSTAQGAETTANNALSTVDAIANTKANKGANSDITSLSGLTTALSIAQGGTGATTATGARSNLNLGSAALKNTGVSGDVVPLLNANNIWSGIQTLGTPLGVASGGTGASTAPAARANLSIEGILNRVVFITSTTTFIPSANAKKLLVYVCGAGGGGGGVPTGIDGTSSYSGSGSSGAVGVSLLTTIAASYPILIGTGGAGGAVGNSDGSPGGSTVAFGITASGGAGGGYMPSGASIAFTGQAAPPQVGATGANLYAIGGVASGIALRIAPTIGYTAQGGSSMFGVGAPPAGPGSSTGLSPSGYGSGGGGARRVSTAQGYPGTAGSGGVVLIYEYL